MNVKMYNEITLHLLIPAESKRNRTMSEANDYMSLKLNHVRQSCETDILVVARRSFTNHYEPYIDALQIFSDSSKLVKIWLRSFDASTVQFAQCHRKAIICSDLCNVERSSKRIVKITLLSFARRNLGRSTMKELWLKKNQQKDIDQSGTYYDDQKIK